MQTLDYSSTFGISQSALKDFRFKSPKQWKKIWIDKQEDLEKSEDTFTFGSLLDTLLFSPELLEKRFYVSNSDIVLPSKAIQSIIDSVYKHLFEKNEAIDYLNKTQDLPEDLPYLSMELEDNKELIINYANSYKEKEEDSTGWNMNWKEDTRFNKIIEQGSKYYRLLCECNGRKIITSDMNFQAIELANILKTSPHTKEYFVETDGIELLFQYEIFTDYIYEDKLIPLKCAIDIVKINHIEKTIRIADFKTSYSSFDFIKSIKQYGYCTQLSFYDFLLKKFILDNDKYRDYIILLPINIVIDLKDKYPYIYEYTFDDLYFEEFGNRAFLENLFNGSSHIGRIKKGWKDILNDICWHYFNNMWDCTKEQYLNGKIVVNLLNS